MGVSFKCPHCGGLIYCSRDLPGPLKAKRETGPMTLKRLSELLSQHLDRVEITPIQTGFSVTKKGWLKSEYWDAINTIIVSVDGQWIPDGKASRWEVPLHAES